MEPERTLHDKVVNDGPTTAHGPLAHAPADLNDREITAQFADAAAAARAREALIAAGIAPAAVSVVAHAAQSGELRAQTKPVDDTLLGRLREAVLPDEPSAAPRAAIAADAAIVTVRPAARQVETAIQVLEANGPSRFDADLARWRNKG